VAPRHNVQVGIRELAFGRCMSKILEPEPKLNRSASGPTIPGIDDWNLRFELR
jgi:hypothetical protein